MQRFWSSKPLVAVSNPVPPELVLDLNSLQEKIDNELALSNVRLDYKIVDTTCEEVIEKVVVFLNNNFHNVKDNAKFIYNKNLVEYFLNGTNRSLSIVFLPVGKNEIIGFIAGVRKEIVLFNENFNCMDVSLLCLVPQLRNLHVSSFMINVLTKECISHFNRNVVCASYTVGKHLEAVHYCKKHYYHRPLNIPQMYKTKMIDVSFISDVNIKVYGSFNVQKEFSTTCFMKLLNKENTTHNDISELNEKLTKFKKKQFDVFYMNSRADVIDQINNDSFYSFAFYNCNSEILDYICFYRLDSEVTEATKEFCRNGYLYTWFFSDDGHAHVFNIMESVSKYCKENNIFDMITMLDPFGTSEKDYKRMKFLKGTGKLYFYMYNMTMNKVDNGRNGLMTI